MLKTTLIAAATAVALAGAAVATVTPASAAQTGYVDIHGPGKWQRQNQWHGGQKKWHARKVCEPIIRWRKIGFHHWGRWQPVVVGWDCDRRHGKHHWRQY